MNYFRCGGGSEKVTIDGVKVKDKLELISDTVANLSRSTLPYDFYNGAVVDLNNEIHILGGLGNATKHYKWNGKTWTEVSTLPYNFYNGAAVVLNGEIHILGCSYSYHTKKHYKFDGITWTEVSTIPDDFCCSPAVVLNGEIHALGVASSRKSHYKWDGMTWTYLSQISEDNGFLYAPAAVYDDEIHVFINEKNGLQVSHHYKWGGNAWTRMSNVNDFHGTGSSVVLDDGIHILGGTSSGEKTHYKWDRSGAISKLNDLPNAFSHGCAAIRDDTINILGGESSKQMHYLINPSVYFKV